MPVEAPNTPAKLWKWLKERGKCSLLDVAEEVYRRALPRTCGKITRKGIVFNGMRYLPEKRAELAVGARIEFAYDTQDTGKIFVLGEDIVSWRTA